MQNSIVVLTFSVLHRKYLFCANLFQKMKIVGLSWNLSVSTKFQFKPTNLIFGPNLLKEGISGVKQKKWALLLFLTRSTHFRQIWSKNTKIASLSWNLAPTLIRICRIQWWCSLFLNLDRKYSFDQIGSKKSKLSFRLKFGTQTKSNIQNLMMVYI